MVLSQALVQPTLPSVLKNMADVAPKAIPKIMIIFLTLLSSRDVRKQSSEIRPLVLVSTDGEPHEAPKSSQTLVT